MTPNSVMRQTDIIRALAATGDRANALVLWQHLMIDLLRAIAARTCSNAKLCADLATAPDLVALKEHAHA